MKKILPVIFFFTISIVIIFSWFRTGMIFGGGDVGLQTYNPIRVLERAVFVWWDSIAPGTTIPQSLTAVPFQALLSVPQQIGFSPVLLQASFFFLILFSMGFGMYLLFRHTFGLDFKLAILGGLFYTLNPYMMIQIWHRFVHSSFFLVAAMPYLILFWTDWIKNRKIESLLFFLLTNLIASYLYGTIAYIITVWLILFLIATASGIFPWEGFKKASRFLARFSIGLILWILTNIWWLIPVTTTTPALLSQQHSPGESLVTLVNISRQAILPYSLQMINPFYLFLQEDFGKFYQNILIRFLPWIFVGIIFTGFINGLKDKRFAKWSVIFLIVLFLTKGSSPPFGHSFILGFEHFFPLGVLRNPFEKMGILLPFVGSILFVLGVKVISEYLEKKLGKIFSLGMIIVILLLIIIFNWFMFRPDVFGKIGKPAFVKVPDSYNQADQWIKRDLQNKESQGKILHLPLTRGESISYIWEYGYGGIEPSDLFFTAFPSISRGFNLKRLDDSLAALYSSFHNFTDKPDIILRLLGNFNVHYIVLHKDVLWQGGDLFDPESTEKILDNLYFLKRNISFGDLIIYQVSSEYRKPQVSLASTYQLIYPSDQSLTWPYLMGSSDTMITPVGEKLVDEIASGATREIIFPNSSFIYPSKLYILVVLDKLASDQANVDIVLSTLTKIIPALVQNGEIQAEELNNKLIDSTKKIIAIFRSYLSGSPIQTANIDEYQHNLAEIMTDDFRDSRLLLYTNELDINLIFQINLSMLEVLAEKGNPQNKIRLKNLAEELRKWMIKNNLSSLNTLSSDEKLSIDIKDAPDRQKAFRFNIPKSGQYEILMAITSGKEFFQAGLENFKMSINGKAVELSGQDLGDMVSFGIHEFSAGDLELATDVHISSNLTQPFDQLTKFGNVTYEDNAIKIEPQGQYGYIESLMPNTKGGDIVRVSFEILAQKTNGFYFQLAQDSDGENESGQKLNQIDEFIPVTVGNWQSFSYTLNPLKPATQQASIRLVVASEGQLPPPSILIRNLRIEKVLKADLVLRRLGDKLISDNIAGQVLDQQKVNPTLYKGSIESNNTTFLIFSETYHPGWKLKLTDGKNTYYPQKHLMANLYGNTWFIEETGNFDFVLEFEPQRMVYIGAIIATLSYLTLIIFAGWKKFRR